MRSAKMESKSKFIGLGFFDVLGIVFIVLKLMNIITWSWWWVLAPIWIQIAVVGVIAFMVVILMMIIHLIEKAEKK